MGNANKSHWSNLIVWQLSHEIVLNIYRLLPTFPDTEKYSLCDQIKRAAVSIPANIVEGHSRNSQKEFTRFLYIARGSLEELRYFMLLSKDLLYISKESFAEIEGKLATISIMVNKLIKSLSQV